MAILFQDPINEDKLRMAYNNDVILFSSNLYLSPQYADITAAGLDVRLYPNPSGRFFFNFKAFVSALINTRNFEDTLETVIDGTADSFIYDFTNGTALDLEVTISVFDALTDSDTYSLSWLAGVMQLNNYHTIDKTDHFVLTPFKRETTNKFYVKYWQGYPFDISLYFTGETIYLQNLTNLLTTSFDVPGKVSRLFFTDGRIDETIEDLLPMVDGYNEIRLKESETPSEDDNFLTVVKVPATCGVYFKWLNKFGGYSYWLFEHTYSIDRSTKYTGEIDRDYSNLENTFGRVAQIGKQSQESIRVVAELLTEDERDLLEGIFDSPKIYLFTGAPYSRADVNDWIEVTLKTSNARIKNAKHDLTNFSLEFETPERYTQTL